MKIKSQVLAHQKPIIEIEISDKYDPKSVLIEEILELKKKGVEDIIVKKTIINGLVIIDTQMIFEDESTITFEISGESIVMNFIYSNNIETNIKNLEDEENSRENTHNILYTNDFNATFQIPALEPINYFSIILSIDFYFKLINEDWKIHQKFSKSILQKKSSYLTSKYMSFNPALQWIIHEIKNCNRDGAIKKMYIETKIRELLILQLESLTEQPTNSEQISKEDLKKLQEAKTILENEYIHAPSLSELSRMISLNEFKLKKGFKTCFGTTVKSYIIKLRMEYAKELLKHETPSVSELAYKCGYKDVSHFSFAFKNFYGLSPQKFKTSIDYLSYFWLTSFLGLV